MEKVSLCMITKNESQYITRCLNSVKDYVNEIIVVDTGSTDGTPGIAQQLGAHVSHFDWQDDFSAARNFSLEKATGDWILFLDADEELEQSSGKKLQEIIQTKDISGCFIKVVNYIGEEGSLETCSDIIFRLFRNSERYRFHGAVHEQIVDVILEQEPNAKFLTCEEISIIHYGYLESEIRLKDKKKRNLDILRNELDKKPSDTTLRYHYGIELYRIEEYEQAANELLTAAQNINPQSFVFPKMLRYIIISFFNIKKYPEAEHYCKIALSNLPDYADIYYYQGLIYYEQKKYSLALESFKQALSTPEQPTYYATFDGVRSFRSNYHCGRIMEIFLNFEMALTYYVKALQQNAYFIAPLKEIVKILNPRKEPDYTKECLQKVFIFDNPQAWATIIQIFYQQGGYLLTLEYLNNEKNGLPETPEIQLMKAVCYIQQKNMLPALRILKNFPANHSLYPSALINLFFCYWLQDNKKRVKEVTEKIYSLGLAEETIKVINYFKDSLYKKNIKFPVSMGGNSKVLFWDLFKRIVDMGDIDKAQLLLSKLSKETLMDLSFDIGKIYFMFGYFKEAEKHLLASLEINPEDLEINYYLGQNYESLGYKNAAIEFYRRAIANKSAEPKFYLRIIKIYQDMISDTLQEAAELYPEAETIRQLLPEVVIE